MSMAVVVSVLARMVPLRLVEMRVHVFLCTVAVLVPGASAHQPFHVRRVEDRELNGILSPADSPDGHHRQAG